MNRDVDRAADAGAAALDQRRDNRQRRLVRRADVADQRTGQLRRAQQAGQGLVVDVVGRALDVRAGSDRSR